MFWGDHKKSPIDNPALEVYSYHLYFLDKSIFDSKNLRNDQSLIEGMHFDFPAYGFMDLRRPMEFRECWQFSTLLTADV